MFQALPLVLLFEVVSCFNFKNPAIGSLSIGGGGNGILPIRNAVNQVLPSNSLNRISHSNALNSFEGEMRSGRTALQAHRDSTDDLLVENCRKLRDPATAALSFPLEVIINSRKYVVEEKVATGTDSTVYEGYMEDAPGYRMIFKVFTAGRRSYHAGYTLEAFKNERIALSEIKRLVDVDKSNLIIVTPKIKGRTLRDQLQSLSGKNKSPELKFLKNGLIRKYLRLGSELRGKYGIVHNDINTDNVIVDDNYDLHLIDFSHAAPLSKGFKLAMLEAFVDDSIALNSLGIDFIGHLMNPLEADTREWN